MSNLAGRNACEARAGLESDQVGADPAESWGRPSGSEKPGAGTRQTHNHSESIRTTGVVSTACEEGSLRQWGRPGMVGESQAPNGIGRMADHLGVGKGQMYQRSRVTPVEGRALASGVLEKKERSGDWR